MVLKAYKNKIENFETELKSQKLLIDNLEKCTYENDHLDNLEHFNLSTVKQM